MFSEEEIRFIESHTESECDRLLLSAGKYPSINVPLCVNSIIARKRLGKKVPEWSANPKLVYPHLLPLEQCSSQATAEYKARILLDNLNRLNGSMKGGTLQITGADLTGGLGIDSFYLSRICGKFHYYEKDEELCRAAAENFKEMEAGKINIRCMEFSSENICELPDGLSFIYVDPARRDKSGSGKKVAAFAQYQPDILRIKNQLLEKCMLALLKVSPMADIKESLKLLPETTDVYVVSVNNECKELLFLMQKRKSEVETVRIHTIDLARDNSVPFSFSYLDEEKEKAEYTREIGKYIFQPGKELLKAGAFNCIAARWKIKKIAPATHLYTSDSLPEGDYFRGKIYSVERILEFNKRSLCEIAENYPDAEISARNFPIDTDALVKRLAAIKADKNNAERRSSPPHIFAVTTVAKKRVLIICALYHHSK